MGATGVEPGVGPGVGTGAVTGVGTGLVAVGTGAGTVVGAGLGAGPTDCFRVVFSCSALALTAIGLWRSRILQYRRRTAETSEQQCAREQSSGVLKHHSSKNEGALEWKKPPFGVMVWG